jgi:hypothetical protein
VNLAPQVWAALIAAAATMLGYVITTRTSRRATEQNRQVTAEHAEVALSAETRQWLTQAQADAREARTESAGARREASSARLEAETAARQLREVTESFASVMRWVERVVRTAHEHPEDLVRIVNGGPPELSSTRVWRDYNDRERQYQRERDQNSERGRRPEIDRPDERRDLDNA